MNKEQAQQAVIAAFAEDLKLSFPALSQIIERVEDHKDADARVLASISCRLHVCDLALAAIEQHFDGR